MSDFDTFWNDLSALCRELPEAEAYEMHGHPSFRVGKKPFVICGGDQPATMSINLGLMDQGLYLEDPRFTRTHYIGQHGWITIALGALRGPEEVRHLVVGSYRRVAPKRALKVLDAALAAR
jgi:predicted DNA-binding protein (MmcQ/YjbR family)